MFIRVSVPRVGAVPSTSVAPVSDADIVSHFTGVLEYDYAFLQSHFKWYEFFYLCKPVLAI